MSKLSMREKTGFTYRTNYFDESRSPIFDKFWGFNYWQFGSVGKVL